MRWKRRGANLGRSRWKLTAEPPPLPSPEGTGTSRRRGDLGKEERDDHGRCGRWWTEHGGGAPEGGGGPSLRSLPEKLGGEGLDLGRRRLSVAALAVSLEPWLLSPTPRGVERFPGETTRVGQGCPPNESVQTSRSISPA